MSCQNDSFFTTCVSSFDEGQMKCIFCNKVFCKITHLEPHPTSYMIHFYYRNRSRVWRRYSNIQFLFDLHRLTLSNERDYEAVVQTIQLRTNKYYYKSKKLTKQEMWVLNERKMEAYNDFVQAETKSQNELSRLYGKLDGCNDNDHKEYYEENIERIEYYVSYCKEIYLDFKEKYIMQEHNRNGTLQEYIDDLYD
jgi:hypothetical protein